MRSSLLVPLVRADRVLGLLALNDTKAPDRFRPEDAELAGAFAEIAVTALEDARLHAAERKKSERQLPGDVAMSIKLNPKSSTPFAVNADLPDGVKDNKLKDCLREAAGAATYPQYDGPPVVVKFNFELDPGGGAVEEE